MVVTPHYCENMFLPTTKEELIKLNWDKCDIIIVTGDTYIDSSFIGACVIGKVLLDAGYRVGIIAQPDTETEKDITRLGEPELLWGVTAGSVDSMVANYTATKKRRNQDDLTPGEINNRRPDRATIAYTNLIRKYFKNTKPIVIGGIEASLRRIAHYDYSDDKIRRSILSDSTADILVYGMAENTVLKLAERIKNRQDHKNIRGICYISKEPPQNYTELPSYEEVVKSKNEFIKMFKIFYSNNDPFTARGIYQKQNKTYLVQNPPAEYLTQKELDRIYGMNYERDIHPYYKKQGKVRAINTIQFSITTHRGCYGECNFCSIAIHQGRTVISRSGQSIIKEAENLTAHRDFKGYITDVGGPTANMYSIECDNKLKKGSCADKKCLYPVICRNMKIDHSKQIELLKNIRQIKGIKKAFVASGVRHDMVLEDRNHGKNYLKEIVNHHVSGQLKIAPEHTEENVLKYIGKCSNSHLVEFKKTFDRLNRECGKKQFLTYYLIAAHPGCTEKNMLEMKKFVSVNLAINPEQVQIFTPSPSTFSTLMYYTESHPFTGEKIFIERNTHKKEKQKYIVIKKSVFGQKKRNPMKVPFFLF